LQRCKNGLRSPVEIQLVLKCQFEYLIKQFFFFTHWSSFSKNFLPVTCHSSREIYRDPLFLPHSYHYSL
jgi:hypothetical protein